MSKIVDFPSDEARVEKASEWLLLLSDRALTVDEESAFKLWLNSSRQNIAAFEEVARVWGRMEILEGMVDLFPLDSLETGQTITANQAGQTAPERGRARWPAVAAAVFCLVSTSAFVFDLHNVLNLFHGGGQYHVTEVGETEKIKLDDGSTITANTDSELRVAVSDNERRVELDRGEAYFEVEHDPDRPFVVYASNGYVRAVGTAFSVYKNGDKVEVIVTEGAVEIVANSSDVGSDAIEQPALLESGQMAEYQETVELVEDVGDEELSRQLFWKKGMLAFEGQSLEEVVDEFSRYTTTDIEIVSDGIRQIRVGGYFRSDDLSGMLAALESNFGIRVTEVSPSLVQLSAM